MANKQFLDKDGADYLVQGLKAKIPTKVSELTNDSGFKTTDNDTKNTAGSTDTSSKIFLVGATSQAANPQTYSHDTAYVGTDGCLYSNGKKVLTDHQSLSSLVPNTRTVNGKALSSDISLTASDVGALPSDTVIPTVNNATLTIQKNGTTVKTFTANASDNVTANITVPTVTDTYSATSSNAMSGKAVASAISGKQDTLVSGTSIKTINNESILGSGNITVSGGGTSNYNDLTNKPQINGVALSGNKTSADLKIPTILTGTTAPTSTLGSNGDIYILLED